MKIFGSSLFQRRNGEASALGEFSFQVPTQRDIRPTRLEVDCFKKRREFNNDSPCNKNNVICNKRRNYKNKLENLKLYENDSDYGSMPRENEIKIVNELEKLQLHESMVDLIPFTSPNVTLQDQELPIFSDCDRVKVKLHPEEEWARNAKTVWWTIKFSGLWKNLCIVTENSVGGSQVFSTEAEMSFCQKSVKITGRFQRAENPDFELTLSTKLSTNETRMGYFMTGCLKQGRVLYGHLETTHYATVFKNDV